MTYTVATLEVSERTYHEIETKLRAAGYEHLFMADGTIDMYGIGLALELPATGPTCTCASRSGPHYCEVHAA